MPIWRILLLRSFIFLTFPPLQWLFKQQPPRLNVVLQLFSADWLLRSILTLQFISVLQQSHPFYVVLQLLHQLLLAIFLLLLLH